MAFNFNWSPLIADTDRVRDMLTNALNKSPKPPIIVDDIVVNELNLGSTPPELEILEIGDLAEDRFRGIFKMSYKGDAYLTLKTRVQANPLNTYLSTKPSFASPQPLAASSSLTIPIQITLSDIRLSGFVILVFSKQKGITIVFRNDPLEKLKVSSTFDSIPFVRDYLQKTIENQLRILFMEDLPAIIHRLSLRVFSPEYQTAEHQEPSKEHAEGQKPIDPFASPAQQPVSDDSDPFSSLTLEPPTETYATFSQKNMVRLAALTESQKTLSLFTPSIRDSIYRAWASAAHRDEINKGTNTPTRTVTLQRLQSSIMSQSAVSSAASQTSGAGSEVTRPSLTSMASASTTYSFGGSASRSRPGKKRKNRVVNLRRNKDAEENVMETASVSSSYDDSATRSVGGSARSSVVRTGTHESTAPSSELREGEITTPPRSARKRVEFTAQDASRQDGGSDGRPSRARPVTPAKPSLSTQAVSDPDPTPRASTVLPETDQIVRPTIHKLPTMHAIPSRSPSPELRRTTSDNVRRSSSEMTLQSLVSAFGESSTGGILEQAWMQKMATEIARKVESERSKQRAWRAPSEDGVSEGAEAPPAYVS
ncbi:mitochondrial distribution and morphology 34 [Lecanosticta acicola]|uniref:Mitochondrial distribution and morphology protein 34 n=1 Tax=Lecanosticta acicola TaxID=111012 RepID=A0AAI8YUC9_9PEZI|nr:mitochondrial distribution and morphology 34 [Lecanosticta acicola]